MVPRVQPDHPFTIVSLNLRGSPIVDSPVSNAGNDGRIRLDYLTANTSGSAITRFNRKGGFHISKMTGPRDSVRWMFNVNTPGKYKISICYAAGEEWGGQLYGIKTGNMRLMRSVIPTGDWYEYHEFPVGYTEIPDPGLHVLSLWPVNESSKYPMYLKSVTLIPVDKIKNKGWVLQTEILITLRQYQGRKIAGKFCEIVDSDLKCSFIIL